MNIETIRKFYRRLNHSGLGVTELVVIDSSGKEGIIATGFFNSEDAFVNACKLYNGRYNIYAGRNPRPRWLPKNCENYLDTKHRQRAKDDDIEFVTAVSLDIDPIRPKGTSSTDEEHRKAIKFATLLHDDIGGYVDDSGNGAYLWIPFTAPIQLSRYNHNRIKQKCKLWRENIAKVYHPEKYGLRIDGTHDLSRIKKVIGTKSVKGKIHRASRFVVMGSMDYRVRDAILTLPLQTYQRNIRVKPARNLSPQFLQLLKTNQIVKHLWLTPNPQSDSSMHDWMLGCELVKAGINAQDLARILMMNPFGKFQRDRRHYYIQTTVKKLMGDAIGS
ncbi:hypothetical protein ACFL6S_13225 [Candidatus Poribacteria bacterium]